MNIKFKYLIQADSMIKVYRNALNSSPERIGQRVRNFQSDPQKGFPQVL